MRKCAYIYGDLTRMDENRSREEDKLGMSIWRWKFEGTSESDQGQMAAPLPHEEF